MPDAIAGFFVDHCAARPPRPETATLTLDGAGVSSRQQLDQAVHNADLARQQVATAEQSRESAKLYETGILPQARLALESALAAYRVNRVDFPMLLDSQMTLFNYEISRAKELVNFNKALAEIELLTGKRTY